MAIIKHAQQMLMHNGARRPTCCNHSRTAAISLAKIKGSAMH